MWNQIEDSIHTSPDWTRAMLEAFYKIAFWLDNGDFIKYKKVLVIL